MTTNYNPNRERIGTLIAFILLCILVMLAASSCGPSYHLKQAKKHLSKAELKGADVSHDTVFKTETVYIPVESIYTDTVFQSIPGDTVKIEKDRLRIEYIELAGDSIYIAGECEADTVYTRVNIPVKVETKIKSGPSAWEVTILCIFIAIVSFVIGMFRPFK